MLQKGDVDVVDDDDELEPDEPITDGQRITRTGS
jgi:hypothetical protein